jgi:hypothetical protein
MLRGVEGPQPDELGGYLLTRFRPVLAMLPFCEKVVTSRCVV